MSKKSGHLECSSVNKSDNPKSQEIGQVIFGDNDSKNSMQFSRLCMKVFLRNKTPNDARKKLEPFNCVYPLH